MKCLGEGRVLHVKGILQEGNNLIFFKQTAVAHSIFTLDGGFQLFCAAFDMPVTSVPLEVALGYKKIDFWELKKNNHG